MIDRIHDAMIPGHKQWVQDKFNHFLLIVLRYESSELKIIYFV